MRWDPLFGRLDLYFLLGVIVVLASAYIVRSIVG
jgi:hypothetical protein